MFSCEFWEIFNNAFFTEHLSWLLLEKQKSKGINHHKLASYKAPTFFEKIHIIISVEHLDGLLLLNMERHILTKSLKILLSTKKHSSCQYLDFSSGLSGLWSTVSSSVIITLLTFFAKTAAESPTCAIYNLLSRIMATVAVVPLVELWPSFLLGQLPIQNLKRCFKSHNITIT